MDADVFPVASMDHHFERRTLPRTTFAAGKLSPLNGGWTVLAPARATFAALYDAVRAGGERFLADRSQFDKKRGWGAELVGWRAGTGAGGDGWTFNAAWSDQGLLYYHFRFVDAGGCDIVTLPFLLKDDGEPASAPRALDFARYGRGAHLGTEAREGFAPAFEHFSGGVKPWTLCPGDARALGAAAREKKWPRSRASALRLWHELYDAHVANATGRALEDVVDLLSAGPRCKRRPRPAPR